MENLNEHRPSSLPASDQGKTVAMVCYIFWIGWIIAFVMHHNNKTALGAYHLRQTLLLFLIGIAGWVAIAILAFIPFIGWLAGMVIGLVVYVGGFVVWLLGLISAVNGEQKPMPLIGEEAQKLFHNL
jgi:uncharacterized membrane protein